MVEETSNRYDGCVINTILNIIVAYSRNRSFIFNVYATFGSNSKFSLNGSKLT